VLFTKHGLMLLNFDLEIKNLRSKICLKPCSNFSKFQSFLILLYVETEDYPDFIQRNTFLQSSHRFHTKLLNYNKSYLNNHEGRCWGWRGLVTFSHVTLSLANRGLSLLCCITVSRQSKEEERQMANKHM
jgi:hypothetical protein